MDFVFDTNNQKFTSKTVFFLICLYVFVTDAFTFKKELLLNNLIVCLQAFCGLNCFEQTDFHQSVL